MATSPTVITGGYWSAVNIDGTTYYQSGTSSFAGPVILSAIGILTVSSGAVVSGATITGGIPTVSVLSGGQVVSSSELNGYLYVNSGAVISGNTLNSDVVMLSAGASSIQDTYINSGTGADGYATVSVASGATLNGATVASGSIGGLSAVVASGATVSGLSVGSGATAVISSGALVSAVTGDAGSVVSMGAVYGSGTANTAPTTSGATVLTGGNWSAVNVDGTTYYQNGTSSVVGPVVLSNIGTLTISSGAVVSGATITGGIPTVSVLSGGQMVSSNELNGYLYVNSGAVISGNMLNSNVVTLSSGASSVQDTFINSGSGADGYSNIMVSSGATVTSPYLGSSTAGYFTMTISSGATVTDPSTIDGGGVLVTSGGIMSVNDSQPCFLADTLIATPTGEIGIEKLSAGDEVLAYENGATVTRHITWAGKGHCVVCPRHPDDEAGYPVRIVKNAITDGMPSKDMLVTSEHCLFMNNRFVPTRLLVNGRSIFYDKSISVYDYYHIETEQHSVLIADGMPTESYLDTGNRRTFRRDGKVVVLMPSRNLTWDNAAAPLDVSRDFVEPLFRQIEARAEKAGLMLQTPPPHLTDDADLHLITDTGAIIRKARMHHGRTVFMLPVGVKSVRIVSNASRPVDVIGPFINDRRMFGVAVGEIVLLEDTCSRAITTHLTQATLEGWNALEWEDTRWTAGNALLPLEDHTSGRVTLLSIQIKAAGPYVLKNTGIERDAV
ncbi:MAG: Hint domain-containing protein [Acetobacter sp.]|uniref:Hint domain-containing protein n=1 Tax=Acetobacter sp. TaxID=440 RepID=UPI0039EC9E57